MSTFLTSSIGKKLIMSISGLFLIAFLCVHLTLNLLLFAGADIYNAAAGFMGSNIIMKIIEPVLGAGFIIHIIYSIILWFQNQKARPVKYKMVDQSESSTWSSRNMIVLGILIVAFLAIHLVNFFYKIKFTDIKVTEYQLVTGMFTQEYWYIVVIYVVGAIFLGLHLYHAFQSAFQTLGLNNSIWRKRWDVIGLIYSLIIGLGFAIIPLYFLVKELI
ncbi:MAG: succinate dehydrogenase [Bacteroidetes bacterium GWF2_38_335]|nr:MAG: succinate dehydrogenase [Bacteroidetes bacterium GWF2_38_335]OFY80907.1 MAG: succinate dehydrogenase [Bacteroidetes bacterium RIFOXYA12_FULL_38_20]HBS84931.1 succinate dehydrogenase [Bacteroidales bacterium]